MGSKQGIFWVNEEGAVKGPRSPRAWRNGTREIKRPGVRLSSTILPDHEEVWALQSQNGVQRLGGALISWEQAQEQVFWARLRSLATTRVKQDLQSPANIPAELLMVGEYVQSGRVGQGLCTGPERVAVGLPLGTSSSPWTPEKGTGSHR